MACGFLCSSCLTHAVLANLDGAATELVSVQCSNGSCGVVRRLEPNDSKSLGSALHVSLHISIHRRELAEQILELLPRHRPRKVSDEERGARNARGSATRATSAAEATASTSEAAASATTPSPSAATRGTAGPFAILTHEDLASVQLRVRHRLNRLRRVGHVRVLHECTALRASVFVSHNTGACDGTSWGHVKLQLLVRHTPSKVSNVHTVGSRRGKTKLFFRSCSDSGFGFFVGVFGHGRCLS